MIDKHAFNKILGQRIREFRKKMGITLEVLNHSAKLDLTKSSISAIETGDQSITSYQLFCIADALNVSVQELFSDFNEKLYKSDLEKKSDKAINIIEKI